MADTAKLGLWVRLEAKSTPAMAANSRSSGVAIAAAIIEGLAPGKLVDTEIVGKSTFGIFDVFPDETGRQAHLSGRVAAALTEKASELFAQPPAIDKIDVLAAKLPQQQAQKVA